jgi:hypothetical protein
MMLADFIPGSDPGLCLVQAVHPELVDFGSRAKREIVTQEQAVRLAERTGAILLGLGGDHSGMIGALAAAGLAAGGDDGRYIELGSIREVSGLVPVETILAAGVGAVKTVNGETLASGMVLIEKLRPARRDGKAVAVVEKNEAHWRFLKLD